MASAAALASAAADWAAAACASRAAFSPAEALANCSAIRAASASRRAFSASAAACSAAAAICASFAASTFFTTSNKVFKFDGSLEVACSLTTAANLSALSGFFSKAVKLSFAPVVSALSTTVLRSFAFDALFNRFETDGPPLPAEIP